MTTDFFLSRDQVREVDQTAIKGLGIPGLLLMENAARGVVDVLQSARPQGRIVILCGPGNNGGDGLAVSRLLAAVGIQTEPWLVTAGKQLSTDAAANLDFLRRSGLTVNDAGSHCLPDVLSSLQPADWIIDALLGTGAQGTVRQPFADVIQQANQSAAAVLAVDLPSGLDCDAGTCAGVCIRAALTVTFVARKKGFNNPASRAFTGDVHVQHIGLPATWLEQWYQRTFPFCSN